MERRRGRCSLPDAPAPIDIAYFDIGGVLGSNGWDHDQRQRAVDQFGLDATEFGYRHHEAAATWEEGRMTLDEYLDVTVFYAPRAFSKASFTALMFAQSTPFPESIALARALHERHACRLVTLNNEAAELNVYRIAHFGLRDIFTAFFSSCWLGIRKPSRAIYAKALAIAQAEPARALMIDDREQNLAPARALGMQTLLFHDAAQLRADLMRLRLLPDRE